MQVFTLKQFAERYGIDPKQAQGYIRDGHLAAIDISSNPGTGRPRWRITEQAIERFESSRTKNSTSADKPSRRRSARRTVPNHI